MDVSNLSMDDLISFPSELNPNQMLMFTPNSDDDLFNFNETHDTIPEAEQASKLIYLQNATNIIQNGAKTHDFVQESEKISPLIRKENVTNLIGNRVVDNIACNNTHNDSVSDVIPHDSMTVQMKTSDKKIFESGTADEVDEASNVCKLSFLQETTNSATKDVPSFQHNSNTVNTNAIRDDNIEKNQSDVNKTQTEAQCSDLKCLTTDTEGLVTVNVTEEDLDLYNFLEKVGHSSLLLNFLSKSL